MPPETHDDGGFERALDEALRRVLAPPPLPAQFTRRLHDAIAGSAGMDQAQRLESARREYAGQLAALRGGYVRLRQRTLGTLIGAAFAAGLLLALALPWIEANFGSNGVLVLPAIGAAVGVGLSLRAWWQRGSLQQFLP